MAIDERRAKFRQDLLSESKPRHTTSHNSNGTAGNLNVPRQQQRARDEEDGDLNTRYRRPKRRDRSGDRGASRRASRMSGVGAGRRASRMNEVGGTDRRASRMSEVSPNRSVDAPSHEDLRSATASTYSFTTREQGAGTDDSDSDDDADEALAQDIQEIWFPGCHADIGAGWPLEVDEEIPLSHGPLVWMVREASKAGLRFDQQKVDEMKCGGNMGYDDEEEGNIGTELHGSMIPQVHITTTGSPVTSRMQSGLPETVYAVRTKLHRHLHLGATQGCMHDVLKFKNGTPVTGVMAWNIMEHLPFRRMDLQKDGSWKSIRWPLPMGEVRDIPEGAAIHNSAIRRMENNESYRPGNLIIGGGGRGVRVAPKEYGIGDWEVLREKGDPVGECMVRKKPSGQEVSQQSGIAQATDFEKA